MAIAFVSASTGTGEAAGVSSTYACGALNCAVGNLLVVWTRSTVAVTGVTDTAGNVYTLANANYTYTPSSVWYAKNIAAHASNVVTFTYASSASYREGHAAQYSGVNKLDVIASGAATGTTVTSGAFTTTNADELIFSGQTVQISGSTWTAGSGYTLRSTNTDSSIQDKIVSTIQTGVTTSVSNTNNGNAKDILVATFFYQPNAGFFTMF